MFEFTLSRVVGDAGEGACGTLGRFAVIISLVAVMVYERARVECAVLNPDQ